MRWATVSLPAFRPDGRPRFLGDWCYRVAGASEHDAESRTLRHPWTATDAELADGERSLRYYESVLPAFGAPGPRYWEVVLGPWLLHFIQIVLERARCIRAALDEDPAFETIGLDAASRILTDGYSELLLRICTDEYNLQLYTRVLEALGRAPAALRPARHPAVVRAPRSAAVEKFLSAGPCGPRTVFAQSVPMSALQTLRLSAASGLVVRPLFDRSCGRLGRPSPPDPARRARLADELARVPDPLTGGVLAPLIAAELPTRYLEDHDALRRRVDARYPRAAKAVVAASAWFGEEAMRLYAARAENEGTALIGMQHGGGYGTNRVMMQEWLERRMTHRYLTWGWTEDAKTEPVAVPRFSRLPRWSAAAAKGPILFASNVYPRWTYRVQCAPRAPHLGAYWDAQLRFFRACPPEVRSRFLYRAYAADPRIMSYQDPRLDELGRLGLAVPPPEPLEAQLARCRLVVVDVNATVLLEALAAGAPVLAWWDPELHPLRASAEPWYAALKRTRILHETPEAAAAELSRAWSDTAAWWNEPERKAAWTDFARLNARRSDKGWLADWKHLLLDGKRP